MRIGQASKVLFESFGLEELPRVVDIGASPLSRPAYAPMLAEGRCAVWGFEPQPKQLARLRNQASERETYFPNAVGTGGPATLNIYRNPGFSSLFSIREATIGYLGQYHQATRLADTIPVETTTLDHMHGLPLADMLKIDVQGAERDILASGKRALSEAVAVIPEVRFYPLYDEEPTFGDLHNELSEQGFRLHKFLSAKPVDLKNSQSGRIDLSEAGSQLVDGDAVYIRPPETLESLSTRQLKCLALFATDVFCSVDLALRCVDFLVAKGAVPPSLPRAYVDQLPKWLRATEPA